MFVLFALWLRLFLVQSLLFAHALGVQALLVGPKIYGICLEREISRRRALQRSAGSDDIEMGPRGALPPRSRAAILNGAPSASNDQLLQPSAGSSALPLTRSCNSLVRIYSHPGNSSSGKERKGSLVKGASKRCHRKRSASNSDLNTCLNQSPVLGPGPDPDRGCTRGPEQEKVSETLSPKSSKIVVSVWGNAINSKSRKSTKSALLWAQCSVICANEECEHLLFVFPYRLCRLWLLTHF